MFTLGRCIANLGGNSNLDPEFTATFRHEPLLQEIFLYREKKKTEHKLQIFLHVRLIKLINISRNAYIRLKHIIMRHRENYNRCILYSNKRIHFEFN